VLVATPAFSQARQRINPDGSIRTVETKQTTKVREVLTRYRAGEFDDDIALLKLAIDETIDPEIDTEAALVDLNHAVFTIQRMAGPNASEAELLNAMQAYIYHAGPYNDQTVFSYDHSDPLGTDINNKLLTTYLDKRLGNCVSMPILVLILGQRLGMEMTLAAAPSHYFIKFKPADEGVWINLEATSGANPARDAWYHEGFKMTPQSTASGIYMTPMNEAELAASIIAVALEDAYGDERWWDAILIAEIIRELDQKNLSAILLRGSALNHLMEEDFHQQWPNPNDVPRELFPIYNSYVSESSKGFRYADSLGFVPEE
jgi:regulator of sirC expression with transglutaminase-like and TPR domain